MISKKGRAMLILRTVQSELHKYDNSKLDLAQHSFKLFARACPMSKFNCPHPIKWLGSFAQMHFNAQSTYDTMHSFTGFTEVCKI